MTTSSTMMTSERKQQILDAGRNLSDPMAVYREGYDSVYPDSLKVQHNNEAWAADNTPVWRYKPAVEATRIAHDTALAWVVKCNAETDEQQAPCGRGLSCDVYDEYQRCEHL